jgi:excisionase family DNA binding protein
MCEVSVEALEKTRHKIKVYRMSDTAQDLESRRGQAEVNVAKLLKTRDAAVALCLSEKTIREWIANRRIGSVRLGAAVRIPETEIARLIEAGTTPARRT